MPWGASRDRFSSGWPRMGKLVYLDGVENEQVQGVSRCALPSNCDRYALGNKFSKSHRIGCYSTYYVRCVSRLDAESQPYGSPSRTYPCRTRFTSASGLAVCPCPTPRMPALLPLDMRPFPALCCAAAMVRREKKTTYGETVNLADENLRPFVSGPSRNRGIYKDARMPHFRPRLANSL